MTAAPLVLVTRTGIAGQALAEQIAGLGFDCLHCAPFELAPPADPEACASDLTDLLPADRVIITSQEGVRQSVALAGANRFDRSMVIVPGRGTANLARDLGIRNVIYPSQHGTSEAMLALPELLEVEGLDILVLAAAGGRGLISQVLRRRGASVDRIEVYRRLPRPVPEDLERRVASAPVVITLAASWEAIAGLCEGVGDVVARALRSGILVAPSQRVADKSIEIGFQRVSLAGGANDEAMLARLDRVTRSHELR